MISSELTEEQLVKEIRRVNKNLSRRLTRIEKRGLEVSTFALNKYNDFKEKLPVGRELRKLDKKQLQSLYRDVKYISNLKSSTVKGALSTKNKFEPIRDRLNTLSKTQQEKFWEIYGKLYETNATMEKFKYEIFNESIDEVFGATETDRIVQDIIDEYNETLKDLGSEADVEQIRKKLFTNKIDKMYK